MERFMNDRKQQTDEYFIEVALFSEI